MEALPNEIILTIVKNLCAQDCSNLIDSTSRYEWLKFDKSIWKFFAWQDLRYPPDLFEFRLSNTDPAELYRQVSKCHHLMPISKTQFVEPCSKLVMPGTSFCRDHCPCHHISICPSCENGVLEDRTDEADLLTDLKDKSRFCRACLAINPETQEPMWKSGCQFLSLSFGQQCGYKRLPNSVYCAPCQAIVQQQLTAERLQHNWYDLDPEPDVDSDSETSSIQLDKPAEELLDVNECRVPNHYVIVSGPLTGVIIRPQNDTYGPLGKAPPDMTLHLIDRVDNLIPLTEFERTQAVALGMVLPETV